MEFSGGKTARVLLTLCVAVLLVVPVVAVANASSPSPAPARNRIATGDLHTCAIASDDVVWCWGDNSYGQLGSSAHGGLANSRSLVPVQAAALPDGRVARSITSGKGHVCVLAQDGSVWCWGDNGFGQSAEASLTIRTDPVRVTLADTATMVVAGGNSTCAVLTNSQLWCWGRNNRGQLGVGTANNVANTSPARVGSVPGSFTVATLDLGALHACATSTVGDTWCWGAYHDGRLGTNVASDVAAPQRLSTLAAGQSTSVSAGADHTCVMVSAQVQCFGANAAGQLGADPATLASSSTPRTVTGSAAATVVTAGTETTCMIVGAGVLECMGSDSSGQLASGSSGSSRHTAAAVGGIQTAVADFSAGDTHACSVLVSGGVRCWGANLSGQLGDGSRTQRTSAVAVGTLNAAPTTTTTTLPPTVPSSAPPTTAPPTTSPPVTQSPATQSPDNTAVAAPGAVAPATGGTTSGSGTSGAAPIVVRRNGHVTARAIAAHVSLAIPKTSRGTMRLTIVRGARSCAFAGARIRGVRRGTCTVLVTVIPKRGKRTLRTTTIVVR